MMKYLLVLLVVAVAVWVTVARVRGSTRHGGGSQASTRPRAMARCAHCGVHLPAAEALIDGSSVYCCDEHRRLGPGATPPQ
jgi:uncharacterized protein